MKELSGLRYNDLTDDEKKEVEQLFIDKVGNDKEKYNDFLICKTIDGDEYYLFFYPETDWWFQNA